MKASTLSEHLQDICNHEGSHAVADGVQVGDALGFSHLDPHTRFVGISLLVSFLFRVV